MGLPPSNIPVLDSHVASSSPSIPSLDTLAPYVSQLTFGGVAGFASGFALKKIGKLAAIALGLLFISVQILVYYGVIEVDWLRVQETINPLLSPDSLDRGWRSLTGLLTSNVPFAAAFIPGFLIGFQRG